MNKKMTTILCGSAVGFALLATPIANAGPATGPNWGQTVKECNLNSCYPNGESRGAFVSGVAQTNPNGYATNIHDPKLNATPGNSQAGLAKGKSPFS